MPAVSLREILQPAFEARYGIGAFNIVNDLTMAAVLDAAVEAKSPVIIRVSVKTVKMWGAKLLQQCSGKWLPTALFRQRYTLDHCPDIEMIKTCLNAGWSSALFDASSLSYQDNLRLCKEVVAFAKKHGARTNHMKMTIRWNRFASCTFLSLTPTFQQVLRVSRRKSPGGLPANSMPIFSRNR
jgi:fructose-bisphosphate aldolase class II